MKAEIGSALLMTTVIITFLANAPGTAYAFDHVLPGGLIPTYSFVIIAAWLGFSLWIVTPTLIRGTRH